MKIFEQRHATASHFLLPLSRHLLTPGRREPGLGSIITKYFSWPGEKVGLDEKLLSFRYESFSFIAGLLCQWKSYTRISEQSHIAWNLLCFVFHHFPSGQLQCSFQSNLDMPILEYFGFASISSLYLDIEASI